jgi:SAM-dependent methyltransferase
MVISYSDVMECLSAYKMLENEKRYLNDHVYRYIETFNLISSIIGKGRFIKRVLDVGSGFGHMASLLKFFFNSQVYCIDFQEKLESILSHRGISFKCIDLEKEKIPFDDNYFDLILFCEVIEHLSPYCARNVLSEIYRILSLDGYLLLTTPARGLFSKIFNILAKPKHSGKKTSERAIHVKIYEYKELQQLLQITGFTTIKAICSEAWETSQLSIRGLPKQLRPIRIFLGNFPSFVESDLMILCIKSESIAFDEAIYKVSKSSR